MRTGVYRKIEGRTGVGQLYEFDCLSRDHDTGVELVTYIPLRIEPEWAGTVRHCTISRERFERKFSYVGEGLPSRQDLPSTVVDSLAMQQYKAIICVSPWIHHRRNCARVTDAAECDCGLQKELLKWKEPALASSPLVGWGDTREKSGS